MDNNINPEGRKLMMDTESEHAILHATLQVTSRGQQVTMGTQLHDRLMGTTVQ